MKAALVQVPYPQPGEALKTLQWQIDLLNNWEEKSVDLIIFPENANCAILYFGVTVKSITIFPLGVILRFAEIKSYCPVA